MTAEVVEGNGLRQTVTSLEPEAAIDGLRDFSERANGDGGGGARPARPVAHSRLNAHTCSSMTNGVREA